MNSSEWVQCCASFLGVNICTGGELTLVGGVRLTNETIRFTVNYRPLDIFNNIKYSLYIAFEYNGIVTITPGYCDIAMIHIDSYNQLAQAEIAPAYMINRVYGKGSMDKTKKFFQNAHTFIKDNHISSTVIQYMLFTPIRNLAPIVRRFGYGLEDDADNDDDDDMEGTSSVTRMKGGKLIPPGSFLQALLIN